MCYLISSESSHKTYIGATKNLDRRIRQHNGVIQGGAKSTQRDRPWHIVCYCEGFETWKEALQFEWHWKHPRGRRSTVHGLLPRIKRLELLLKNKPNLSMVTLRNGYNHQCTNRSELGVL